MTEKTFPAGSTGETYLHALMDEAIAAGWSKNDLLLCVEAACAASNSDAWGVAPEEETDDTVPPAEETEPTTPPSEGNDTLGGLGDGPLSP